MKAYRQHISQLLATFLLFVFAIALTPWSSLHHHQEEVQERCVHAGNKCQHQVHISKQQHNCLICSAHFEKNYVSEVRLVLTALNSSLFSYAKLTACTGYSKSIIELLRGPPLV